MRKVSQRGGGGRLRCSFTGQSEEADGEVAQPGHNLRCGAGSYLRAVFIQGHIPYPVDPVLDTPMTPPEIEQPDGVSGGGSHELDRMRVSQARVRVLLVMIPVFVSVNSSLPSIPTPGAFMVSCTPRPCPRNPPGLLGRICRQIRGWRSGRASSQETGGSPTTWASNHSTDHRPDYLQRRPKAFFIVAGEHYITRAI